MSATLHRLVEADGGRDDLEDFSVFYRRYWPRLVRLVQRRTGDRELSEDIAQETLVRALGHMQVLDGSSSLWPWLKTVAIRLVIENARRSDRELLVETSDEATCGPSPDELIDFDSVISALPKRQRIAIALRYVEGWRSSEAAAFLGLNRVAFDQLLSRARRSVKIQYSRMAREALGAAALGGSVLRRIRGLIATTTARIERATTPLLHASPAVTSQVVVAVVATLVTAGPTGLGRPRDALPVPLAHVAAAWHGGDTAPRSYSEAPSRVASGTGGAEGTATTGTTAPTGGSGSGTSAGRTDDPAQPLAERAKDDLADPNRHIKQPEDAQILSLAFVPDGGEGGRTVYASGTAFCRLQPCAPVLFRSNDAGASWSRLPAQGLRGTEIAIPAGYSKGNKRIFAMGSTGLQVSVDGGRSFDLAAASGVTFATGSIALSPNFQEKPSVLIGAQTLVEYNDASRASRPYPATALHGPFEPAFSPAYPADPRIVIGGQRIGDTGAEATVFVCRGPVCTETPLAGESSTPNIRLAADFFTSGVAYAFTEDSILVSTDGALRFHPVGTPWGGTLRDVTVDPNGSIIAAVASTPDTKGGLYMSSNGGGSWFKVRGFAPRQGSEALVSSGNDVLIAALEERGLMCSSDEGKTWSERCSAPSR